MGSELFNTVSLSLIFALALTFTLSPLSAGPTGSAVENSAGAYGQPLYVVIFLLLIGIIFIAITRIGAGQKKGGEVYEENIDNVLHASYPTVAQYVKDSLKVGYNPNQVEEALLSRGWPTDFVRNIITLQISQEQSNLAFKDIDWKDDQKPIRKRRHYNWF